MFRRLFAFILLAWALGFAAFALMLPRPADATKTDGVVVVTGGPGRIARGVESLERGWSKQLLVSGVDSEVKPAELAIENDIPARLMKCCITLGYDAVDTRSNASETAAWAKGRKIASVRLVTSDWHMRRASHDLEAVVGPEVTVLRDAVPTREPKLSMLFLEYHKLIFGHIARWLNL